MGNKHNILEVNGRRYDARTGRLLDAAPAPTHHNTPLEGISKRPSAAHLPARPASHTAHAVHQKTEKSKTLMRHAVRKPAAPTHKPKLHTGRSPSTAVTATTPTGAPTPARLTRAQQVPKSHLISKFGSGRPALKPQAAILPVQPAPALQPEHETTIAATLHHAVSPFQQAIERATSHTEPKPKRKNAHHRLSRKLRIKTNVASAGAATLGVLLIGGFFAYQNVPNLAMRVASAKAGVRGNLPAYRPSGFSLKGPIQFTPGQVTVSYRSNSDDRQFSVTQRSSSWNNETLLNNFVAVNRRPYQSYQDSGRTIYIYDGGNATWIDRGVWYQIEGNTNLSSDQLLRMAASL